MYPFGFNHHTLSQFTILIQSFNPNPSVEVQNPENLGPRVSKERCSGQTAHGPLPIGLCPTHRTLHESNRSGQTRQRTSRGSDKLVKVHSSGFSELRAIASLVLCAPHYHAGRQGTTRAEPVLFPLMTYVPRAEAYGDTLRPPREK